MAKRANKPQPENTLPPSGAWLSMRTGLIVIAITSVAMGVLTTVQAWATKPPLEAIFWGVAFGVFIWAIFFGMILFNRFMGRR